jgi:hypothetical protein
MKLRQLRWRTQYIVFLLLLVGCTAVTAQPEVLLSSWGIILTLGQAEQADAPSVWASPNGVRVSWIGADETGIHQDIRTANLEGLSERVVLPLPPANPYDQMMLPASDERVHLLWLDTHDNQPHLYSAIITPDHQVERGPTLVSDETARRYTAVGNGDGSLWTVWSGGKLYEPRLFARQVDSAGRPTFRENYQIARDADWPTIARTNDGTLHLFWIQPSDRQVMGGQLVDGQVENVQPITQTIQLQPGDRLTDFSAGFDLTHGYLFWNVTRADGTAETWYTSGAVNTGNWAMPQQLGINREAICQTDCTTTATIQTGLTTGATFSAEEGADWASWASPLAGQFDTLPLAVQVGDEIGVIYLQNGNVAGYWGVTTGDLIGKPNLTADSDRYLYLTWAQTGANGMADMQLATIKSGSWGWLSPLRNN